MIFNLLAGVGGRLLASRSQQLFREIPKADYTTADRGESQR
jgi:hypothetical protein